MKEENKILKSSLKKLVARFGREDFVSAILRNPEKDSIHKVDFKDVCDNHYLKKAVIDEVKITQEKKKLRENGVIDPIIVRSYKNKYEVVVGRVKYFAAKEEKLDTVTVIVLPLSDEESLLFMLKEISDRKAMNIYELALICSYLKNDFGYKNKELADFLNQSSSQISNLLQLLTLPDEVLTDISSNKLSYGHAKAISRLSHDEVISIVNEIYEKHLSVRDTEDLVRKLKGKDVIKNDVKLFDKPQENYENIEEKSSFDFENKKVVLIFKDGKSYNDGVKRINKLIKRKKFVLK